MTSHLITPVILCGGSGTRLWPLSRSGFPKQFLVLSGTSSLFQQAVERVNCLAATDIHLQETLVVTNEEHRFLALDQLREFSSIHSRLLLEPVGRNTAPALTLAALQAQESGHDTVLVVTPADQVITNPDAFRRSMQQAIRTAATGSIVILGIPPNRPETGYGYIKTTLSGQALAADQPELCTVDRFTEKPDAVTAQAYLNAGGYFWNAGIFVLKASTWLSAIAYFRPDMAENSRIAWHSRTSDNAFTRPEKNKFSALASESIDYAVIESCPGSQFPIQMVTLDAGWSDLGSWDAVWNIHPQDKNGNVHLGDVLNDHSHNTLVHSTHRLVGVVGVKDLVVIETADAVLVADKTQSQNVKNIVNTLQQQKREEHSLHRKVHRPWGWYDSIDEAERFKVKRIQVNPGASLSLQKHFHRAEHWVVVKGTAEITCGKETFLLHENQSTYIPQGEIHRLANPGTMPLEIIEVQSGSYLGEDDIVRLEDTYGRSS